MKILLIEDEQRLADFLVRGLQSEGYNIEAIMTINEAMPMIRSTEPDLVILDRLLEDGDGLKVCRDIRSMGLPCKILMLSALSEVDDRVLGLRTGADDYLGKPFHFEELLARIDALLNRENRKPIDPILSLEDLNFNLAKQQVERGKKLIELTAKELRILEMLMRNPGRVLSRERILSHVWGYWKIP